MPDPIQLLRNALTPKNDLEDTGYRHKRVRATQARWDERSDSYQATIGVQLSAIPAAWGA